MSLSEEQLVFWMDKILKSEFDSMFSDDEVKNAILVNLEVEGLIETSTYRPAGAPLKKCLGVIRSKGIEFALKHGLIKQQSYSIE